MQLVAVGLAAERAAAGDLVVALLGIGEGKGRRRSVTDGDSSIAVRRAISALCAGLVVVPGPVLAVQNWLLCGVVSANAAAAERNLDSDGECSDCVGCSDGQVEGLVEAQRQSFGVGPVSLLIAQAGV